jgi:hypothetical protein
MRVAYYQPTLMASTRLSFLCSAGACVASTLVLGVDHGVTQDDTGRTSNVLADAGSILEFTYSPP